MEYAELIRFIMANFTEVILLLASWLLGVIIKNSKIPNHFIPWLILAACSALMVWHGGVNPVSVSKGITVGFVSLSGYDLAKVIIKNKEKIKKVVKTLGELFNESEQPSKTSKSVRG